MNSFTSVLEKAQRGNFLRYPVNQCRKVKFCPVKGQKYGENRGKTQASMAWGARRRSPGDLRIFQKTLKKHQKM